MTSDNPGRSALLLSGIVIGGLLADFLLRFLPRPEGFSILPFLLPSLLVIGGAIILWTWGLRFAGHGLRRILYLGAFAGSMVWLGVHASDFITGERSPFAVSYAMGAQMAAEERASAGLPPRPGGPRKLPTFPRPDPLMSLLNWVLLTSILGAVLHRLQRTTEHAQAQEHLAAEATHRALRAKLAPHFIFNTLNTLHAQIEADPRGAQATTENLARLFRQVLELSEQATIPLREELSFVESYLGIEQKRLGERLRVRIEIPEELEGLQIPPLSLQVLVENAVKHGVALLESGGAVVVGGQRLEGGLELWVEDPGTGISEQRGTGTALETLRQRLRRSDDLRMCLSEGRHRVSFTWKTT